MKKITILCDCDVLKRPRPYRLLRMLQEIGGFNLSVIAKECSSIQGVKSFSFPPLPTAKERTKEQDDTLRQWCQKGAFEKLIFTSNRLKIREFLRELPFQDLLIVEDITLLPFALESKKHARCGKVLIDLREYYPLEYENSKEWLEGFGLFFKHLCEVYLPEVDYALCVSEGLLRRYKAEFGIQGEVFLSLPKFVPARNLALSARAQSKEISLLYHGFVSADRSSENLLELAKKLPAHYKLYLMVLSNQPQFLYFLQERAKGIENLVFLPPVSMGEIVNFSARFCIGLIPFFPTTFNLMYCMPNKLFEYLQARLCVLTTPLESVGAFVKKNQCGIVAEDFSVDSLVKVLQHLSVEDIASIKAHNESLAQKYSTQANIPRLKAILQRIL
ncbi:capsular biosynthesis protein [Helicobacter himalayensis]|uniref:capsular biosynthesis protein n=1 Tax=Helicobacter himalayensis TaxID=1591088 RepID=UPI003D6F4BCE